MNETEETKINATLAQIAHQRLGIPTLETRNVGDADFHEVAVWRVEAALRAAFEAGREAGRAEATKPA